MLESDIRSTPDEFFNKLDKVFKFDVDVCANENNKKCEKYFNQEQDGLSQEWGRVNWCNPPYSRGQLDLWLKKGLTEQGKGKTVVFLVPGDTSTKWYQENILAKPNISVQPVYKRLKFEGSGTGAKFASHLVIMWGFNNA